MKNINHSKIHGNQRAFFSGVMTLPLLVVLSTSILQAQTTSTWSLAGDGIWKDAANWNTAAFPEDGQPDPADTYNAVLNTNRTITLDGSVSIQGLTQSTGTITGSDDKTLTLAGPFAWSGGALAGGMMLDANGGVSITNSINHELNGGTIFNNTGTMTWTQGSIGNNSGDWTFQNTATGVINVNANTSSVQFGAASGSKTINNAGTIHYTATAGANFLNIIAPLHNSGLITLSGTQGFVNMHSGTNTGEIQVGAGRTLWFQGGGSIFTQSGDGSITGAGTVRNEAGTITFGTDTTYNVGGTQLFSGGMVFNNNASTGTLVINNNGRIFGSGTLTATGLFTWTGGAAFPNYSTGVFDSLTIRAEGGMLMEGASKAIIAGGTVRNFGAAEWTSGNLVFKPMGGSATTRFINEAGGTINLQSDVQIQIGGAASTDQFINAGTFTKSGGAGTSTFASVFNNSGIVNVNAGTINFTGTYNQTAGSLILDGGNVTKTGTALAINAGSVTGHGTITGQISNAGTVRAEGGTLTVSNGVVGSGGTIETASAAGLSLNGTASSASILDHGGTSLALASNLTVSGDYTNASFGNGNSFDPRANVSGAGQILAGGTTGQSISGAFVIDGTTSTPTLNLGTHRQGSSVTRGFTIDNPGATGPLLRGALQTTVNGGNITDTRLAGSGVTPGNFSVAANSSSGTYSVQFNATSGGPLTGQSLHLQNNFDNVPGQTVSLTGAIWGFAIPQITSTTPITFGNVRIGKDLPYVPVVIKNNAPDDGWHEGLAVVPLFMNIDPEGPSEINALPPQATDGTTIALRIPTDSPGFIEGLARLDFESDGTGTSDLSPNAPLATEFIDVTGTVYDLADPSMDPEAIDFDTVRVGDVVPPVALEISNQAAVPFREGLNAEFNAATVPAGYHVSGSIANLAPGASSTALEITMDTSSSGPRNSDALRVKFASDGVATGEAPLALEPAKFSLTGSVWQPAIAEVPLAPNVLLGNYRVGMAGVGYIPVRNAAPDDGFSESLMADFSVEADGDMTFSEYIKYLPPQALNTTNMKVEFSTATPGARSGQNTLLFASSGLDTSGIEDDLPLAPIPVTALAKVYRAAIGDAEDQIIAYVRKDETNSITGNIRIYNLAENDLFSERLITRIDDVSENLTVEVGESERVDPEASDGSLSVTMDVFKAEIGDKIGIVNLEYFTDGGGTPETSGLSEEMVGSTQITVSVRVQNPASSLLTKVSGAATFGYNPFTSTGSGDFATVESIDGLQTLVVELKNGVPSDFQDNLKATFDDSALAPFVLVPPVAFPSNGLPQAASRNFSITLDPSALPAGPVSGNLIINPTSSNPTSDAALPPITLTFSAEIVIPSPYEIWAAQQMLTGVFALPTSDPDGDGDNNFKEFAFGSNPMDATSRPHTIQRPLEDENGKFLAVLTRVRKGDQSPFLPMEEMPPLDRPSRAIRDGIRYTALGATHPDSLFPGLIELSNGTLLEVVPLNPPTGFDDIPPPGADYEDIIFRFTDSMTAQPKAFFRMMATEE